MRNLIALLLLLVCFCASGIPLLAQAPADGPITIELLREMIDKFPDARVRREVNARKVSFELTPALETELRKKDVPQETIDLIRVKFIIAKATLEIACRPVDCEVSINDSRVGSTVQNRLRRTDQDPARIAVSVRASGYKDQTALVQLLANSTATHEFVLERIPAPTPPPAPAVTPAPNPNPAPPTTPAPAPVRPATPPVVTPDTGAQQIFNRVLDALGGVAALKGLSKYTATGNLTLVTGRGPQTEAQVTESVSYPKSIKWELRIAGVKWTVTNGPDETWSDGDAKYKGSELAQELERNIKRFIPLHLPALFGRLQERDVKVTLGPVTADQTVLIAQTTDDKYTLTLDSSYRPLRALYEPLAGLQGKTEIVYARYEMLQGKLMLPMSMTLRNPNQPDYGHEIRYTKIDPLDQPKDSEFKRRGLFGVLPGK